LIDGEGGEPDLVWPQIAQIAQMKGKWSRLRLFRFPEESASSVKSAVSTFICG
jgi:hypothetical protein